MNKTEKEVRRGRLEKFTNGFWNIDCLIRIMKEITTNSGFETQEEDIYIICDLLVKEAESLAVEIKLLRDSIE